MTKEADFRLFTSLSIFCHSIDIIIFQMEGITFVDGRDRFALEVPPSPKGYGRPGSLRLELFLPALCESRALRTPLIILVNKYPISSICLE